MTDDAHDSERMGQAFRVAGKAYRERLRQEAPGDDAELQRIEPSEVVVVRGEFDRISSVLAAASVAHLAVYPHQLARCDWDRMQVLMIDCPGRLPVAALDRIGPWVRGGGYLVTTDWAVKHVLEPVFPGRVRHNGRSTDDCVVRIQGEPASSGDPLLAGILEAGREPLWWLEEASYPIEVLDAVRVRVLAKSREVEERWGTGPIALTFDEGKGTVLHLLSHLYLQRSEVRDARDAQPAAAYLREDVGLPAVAREALAGEVEELARSEIEGAYSSASLASRAILERRRRLGKKGGPDER